MAFVLVVEDEPAVSRLLKKFLERAGHAVCMAANGEQALKLYFRYPIDVVVTDIQMPRGDGLELIGAIKGLFPDASIVAISGQGSHQLQFATLAGACTTLTKPIYQRDLIDAVEEAATPSSPAAP